MTPNSDTIGRPVRILSLSFPPASPLEKTLPRLEEEAAKGPVDLIALPEMFGNPPSGFEDTPSNTQPENFDGPLLRQMGEIARKYHCYMVCPIDRMENGRRYNTAVLLDREGRVAGHYDKVYPFWSEFEFDPPALPGLEAPAFDCDFGKLGLSICFDANFPEVWKRLADLGAEVVVWPSAYSAGMSLQAHAINHQYYIVTSTLVCDCIVYDISGREIHYQKTADFNASHILLDLDRGIYHQNYNIPKRDKLLAEHPDDIEQEEWLDREQWFIMRARRPGVSARALAREYGMEELRDYKERSRRAIDQMRTWPFLGKNLAWQD